MRFLVVTAALLGFALEVGVSTQSQPAAPAPSEAAQIRPPVAVDIDAEQLRVQFEEVLRRYPPEVGRILKMDPTMLGNGSYLSQYPALQQFVAAHPEVTRNPSFYLAAVRLPFESPRPTDPQGRAMEMWGNIIENVSVFVVLVFVSSMIAWLIRTLLHHRRWLRMVRQQNEVHQKLLDRFAGTSELLGYIQTPAGRRFLEGAPVPVEGSSAPAVAAPVNRMLWSVQAGIVLVVAGFGFQYVSGAVIAEVGQGLWAIGVLAVALGTGFILASVFSYMMSRRLGLLDPAPQPPAVTHGESSAL